MSDPVHVDLFSGIGGIALAARWAGFRTALFCEIDPYCRRVLAKHWPGVPIHDDVRTLDRPALEGHGIGEVALLTGGFPCQPFSCAGKRRGQSDHRFLWPAMLGVVRQCRPAWVVGENVAGFVRVALDDVLADLEAEGYACRAFLLPAAAVGAPHQRDRCFVVAHAAADRRGLRPLAAGDVPRERGTRRPTSPQPGHQAPVRWWHAEPPVGRVADGVPRRLDRLKGLGNAVVPQQIFPILSAVADLLPA